MSLKWLVRLRIFFLSLSLLAHWFSSDWTRFVISNLLHSLVLQLCVCSYAIQVNKLVQQQVKQTSKSSGCILLLLNQSKCATLTKQEQLFSLVCSLSVYGLNFVYVLRNWRRWLNCLLSLVRSGNRADARFVASDCVFLFELFFCCCWAQEEEEGSTTCESLRA